MTNEEIAFIAAYVASLAFLDDDNINSRDIARDQIPEAPEP